jgi:hypothetical protein
LKNQHNSTQRYNLYKTLRKKKLRHNFQNFTKLYTTLFKQKHNLSTFSQFTISYPFLHNITKLYTTYTILHNGTQLLQIQSSGYDGLGFIPSGRIETYVSTPIVEGLDGFTATLSTGTASVTLTGGGTTAGLTEGQYLYKNSGTGVFGTNWDGSGVYIASIDGPSTMTLSVNHATAGAISFSSNGLIPTTMAFSSTSTDGKLRRRLRIRDNGAVSVGPDAGDFDDGAFTGQLQVISTVSGNHDYNLSAFSIRGVFDGVLGQEIAITRARGTIEQGGAVYSPAELITGDEVGSLGFYAFYEPNPGADNIISSRISAGVTGTITSSAAPGILKFQPTNATGAIVDSLTLTATKATFAATQTLFPTGTEAIPSITFTGEGSLDTGIWSDGDGILCISANGTEKVRVDTGGMRVDGFIKVAQVSGTLPTPPEAGMIVLDGTTFKGYNGSAWVDLN